MSTVTVAGAGVIGTSWAGLLLAHGHTVTVYDIADDAPQRVRDGLARLAPALEALGLDLDGADARLSFTADLATAVRGADVVQENGPERRAFKREFWAEVERHAPRDALLLSSSSGYMASMQSGAMGEPGRLIVGHPFNPPHLVPLVEVVPSRRTEEALVERALEYYRGLGKVPIRLHREIPGFVANRLQAVLIRESMSLVRSGVVTVAELDDVVTHSLGPRWATAGPFASFHLGGGPRGFRGYLDQFATGLQLLWLHSALRPVVLTPRLKRFLATAVERAVGGRSIPELEQERDRALLRVRAAVDGD